MASTWRTVPTAGGYLLTLHGKPVVDAAGHVAIVYPTECAALTAAAEIDRDAAESVRHLYAPLYRPAGFAGLPRGWEYVEAPRSLAANRPDLPVSKRPHGVISYPRPLTAAEIERYEVEAVR